jgi:hypothetical protein
MADATTAALAPRWYHRLPLAGRLARELETDFEGNIGYFVLMLLSLVGIAVMTWGLPALGLIALGTVPVMFALIILITWG